VCANTAVLNRTLRSFLILHWAVLVCHVHTHFNMVEHIIAFDISYII